MKTIPTTFSSWLILPNSTFSLMIISLPIGISILCSGNTNRVSTTQQMVSITKEKGNANAIHDAKLNSTPYNLVAMDTKIGLVGVPTRVATPPIEAENAMPSSSALKKSFPAFPVRAFISEISAVPMVTIIKVVAVLEIHIESSPLASIKPRTINLAFVPTAAMISMAIRLCRFHRCIAIAMINPPTNR